MRCRIKICGICNRDDLDTVASAGADYAGVLVEIDSPRGVSLEEATRLFAQPKVSMVAVMMDRSIDDSARIASELQPSAIQLHGHETPETVAALVNDTTCEVWKVIHIPSVESGSSVDISAILTQVDEYVKAGVDKLLLDATVQTAEGVKSGGTGKSFDWKLARQVREEMKTPLILAGGINPENVIQAIRVVEPFAVDCSSGVEAHRCKKDPMLVETMVTRSRVSVSPRGEEDSYE